MRELENLVIYKANFDMIYYSEMLLAKFPKLERNLLVKDIRNINLDNMRLIIKAYKEVSKSKKHYYLNELDVNLKLLKVMVRLSFKKKYISEKTCIHKVQELSVITKMIYGWIKNGSKV